MIRGWHALVLNGICALWGLLAGLTAAALDTPLPAACWLMVPVLAAAVVRTVTRPLIDYTAAGMTDTPMGELPLGLIRQVLRGPDLALIGAVLLATIPFSLTLLALPAALIAWEP